MSGPASRGLLLVVCGLEPEARIARGSVRSPDVTVVAGGGDQARLARDLERLAPRARAVLSFGVAGGLAPARRPGDVVVAEEVVTPDGARVAADRRWAAALLERLQGGAQQGRPQGRLRGAAVLAAVAGADAPVMAVGDKAALQARTGAEVVDMESHWAAGAAVAAGVPFAVLRVVTDPAGRALPPAAFAAMRPDGGVNLPAILRSLGRDPGQLPGLVRTGLDARRAFGSLLRCRQLLGPGFALGDLG